MNASRKSRREFLRQVACLACSGGAAAIIPQLRMIGTALAGTNAPSGYKALVCIYLQGGNDSWNLVVPWDSNGSSGRYDVYAQARNGVYSAGNGTGLALARPNAGNGQIVTDGNDANAATNQYFIHPNLTNLANIYKTNKLAFAVNVGTLVQPIDMNDYDNPLLSALRPPQLFSHADQTSLWHQGNTDPHATLGWGGLCADDLQTQNANNTTSPQLPLTISIAGANRFEIGQLVTSPYQLSSSGLTNLSGMCNPCTSVSNTSVRDTALNALLGDTYASDFAGEYARVFGNARALFSLLKADLGQGNYALTTTFPNTTLGNQLKTVAQMIKLSQAKNYASRQIYFVQLGGFDLHSGMMSTSDANNPPTNGSDHAGLLYQLDQAIGAFWTELGAQGLQNSVTTFSMTEFARTLQSNGAGSDHAWGGVQFALGGAVNGGKLYTRGVGGSNGKGIDGAFPNFAYGTMANANANAFSRGQLIPGLSVDQYAATFAKWMNVSAAGVSAAFPNLAQFNGTLGLLPAS